MQPLMLVHSVKKWSIRRVSGGSGARKELWGLDSQVFVTSVLRRCASGCSAAKETVNFEEANLCQ